MQAQQTAQNTDRRAIAKMLFEHWKLATDDQLPMLGLAPESRSTLAKYRKGSALANNRDLMERAGHLLGIHKNLRLLFPHHRDAAYQWMKTRNMAFRNMTPVEVVQTYGFAGLLMVRALP